ncbi:helix-turn-helix domain-containing protein [Marivirga lumbricoides]
MSNLILILSAGQGSILSIALISRVVKSDYFRFFFGILLFVISIEIWTYWGIQTRTIQSDFAFPCWNLSSYLLFPPALNYILHRLRFENYKPNKLTFIVLIPGILEIIVNVIRYYSYYYFDFQFLNNNVLWIFYTQIAPLIWLGFVLIINMKWKKQSTKYLLVYIYSFLVFLLWLVDYIFPHQIFTAVEIILIATLFVLGYLAYIKPNFFQPPSVSVLDLQYSNYNHVKYCSAFKNYIQEESYYKDSGLTLKQAAKEIEVSPKYLSYLVNKFYQMNFKNYLNQQRVQKVIEELKAGKHKKQTLLSIALDAGFNSKSSFNAIFKSLTGHTPTEYLKNIDKNLSENR